ncbi:hypothetical protein [Mesobacillus subterraneus]|uniref:Uncharacterized protein n=1 Tax=Mesobacillus subterraneus TaxID=285983 RepID=A0A427TWD8_9BACI|nr:hypothetical protein [Mesobacillus subterraneus]RSD28714.1 hypothetical protein EJA10_03830 [Mesobacillus subterraneus]
MLSFCFGIGEAGFDITIKNQTNEDVSGLTITYNEIVADIKIPTIPAGGTYELTITPEEEFGENSMILYYNDRMNQQREETVIGYFEQGYYGEAIILLEKVNPDGTIQMKIEENLF